ncbi:MAG: thioesterase domain-containing protein [Jatrophihabitantaceae bacterium]
MTSNTASGDLELTAETPYLWTARRPGHRHRLICFPHAGGGAGTFADWAKLLPAELELAAVQLPGRQDRIAEEPFTEVAPLVRVLCQALRPVLDGSVAFFGHSGGATLAFEVARALRQRGLAGPTRLFLSSEPAPGARRVRLLHDLPDEQFRAEVLRMGGIDEEIAAEDDVMDALLPALRADFQLWERHQVGDEAPLDIPITVLGGRSDDRTPAELLLQWRPFTTAELNCQLYDGGHFYFMDQLDEVIGLISRTLLDQPQAEGSR